LSVPESAGSLPPWRWPGTASDVRVYEQAPQLGEVGAGVVLAPNSLRLLQRLGLGAEISRCGARLADTQLCRADGRPVAHDPEQFSRPGERYGMHRADLLAMLAPSGQQMRESWSGPGDPAALAARFAGWDPVVGTIIDAIGSTGFRWGLYDRAPLRHCAAGSAAG